MNKIMIELAKQLGELIAKQTATTVQTKIAALKSEKDIDKVRQTYNELLNNLLSERADAIAIAQAYRDELEKVEISDEDIDHLHNTVENILDIFRNITVSDNDNDEIGSQIFMFEQFKDLISVDTLRTMQLLGFNYKKAIGDPLTIMLRNFILSKAPETDSMKVFDKVITPEMVNILKNPTAYDNLKDLMTQNEE